MEIKRNFTIETAAETLRKELSTHISVVVRSNIIDNNKKWIEINKDAFVGVRVTFNHDGPILAPYLPNTIARAAFGGIVSGIFHHKARNEFKKQIATFLIAEFYVK